MNTRSTQPFGRRGLPSATARVPPRPAPQAKALSLPQKPLSPELVATLLQPEGQESAGFARQSGKVPRSFRAALLAGLIVACLNAAANATFAASATRDLGMFSFGSANVPVLVALLLGALWSGARTSAACLLIAHRLLAAWGRTSPAYYVLGGGVAAVGLALLTHVLDGGMTPTVLAMDAFSGMVAGFFYRLFAGLKVSDA